MIFIELALKHVSTCDDNVQLNESEFHVMNT